MSSETPVVRKINWSETNFVNLPISVNNIYNSDAILRPVDGINEKRFSKSFKWIRVSCFNEAMKDGWYFSLTLFLRKKSAALVSHRGTNNLSNETSFQISNKLESLVTFIKESNPNCHVALSSSITILDNGKVALTIKRLSSSFLDSARY